MVNDGDTDLFPWIFGGLLTAAVAMAFGISASHRPLSVPAAIAEAPAPTRAADPAPVFPPPAPPAVLDTAAAVALHPAAPTLPTDQVWECESNGTRTFSDAPCGERAAIHEIREVNTMAATAVPRRPDNSAWLPPPDAGYAPAADQEDTGQAANGVVVLYPAPLIRRGRPEAPANGRTHTRERSPARSFR